MKIKNSLRSLRARHRGNRLVRRKGRVYIINKTAEALQGAPGLTPAGPTGPPDINRSRFDAAAGEAYPRRP